MMERKEFYAMLEKVEGGADLVRSAKGIFSGLDEEAKGYRTERDTATTQNTTLADQIKTLTEKAGKLDEVTGQKTGFENQLAEMQKTLDLVITERDDEKKISAQLAGEKKTSALHKHFHDSVSEAFGSQGANDAVAVSLSKLGYSEDGKMSYDGKFEGEATEAFKADNQRFLMNKGTGTSGGESSGFSSDFEAKKAQMLRD